MSSYIKTKRNKTLLLFSQRLCALQLQMRTACFEKKVKALTNVSLGLLIFNLLFALCAKIPVSVLLYSLIIKRSFVAKIALLLKWLQQLDLKKIQLKKGLHNSQGFLRKDRVLNVEQYKDTNRLTLPS